jgi:sacsin
MANRSVPFSKTIIRLPLRTTAGAARSLIKKNSVEPSKIRQLFDDFIKEEIDIVLLFLTHISSIEMYEVDDQGITRLASVELVKSASDSQDANTTTYRSNVKVTTDILGCVSQSWRVLCASYPDSEAATILSERLGYDVDPALKRQKLVPNIAIAMPLPLPSSTPSGRLYTYLPLPLSTGFRCHIHGLFALTPDRQHLRNGEETGVVKGDDRSVIFDRFVGITFLLLN